MGKKYNTATTIAAYDFNLEPLFEYTAYEGIKPSRAVAIKQANRAIALLEADALAERPTNRKAKTDKIGRRPRIEAVVVEQEVEGPHECIWQDGSADSIYHHSGWVEVIVARCECGGYRITPVDSKVYLSEDDHAAQVWIIKAYKNPVAYVSESFEGNSPFKKLDK